MQINCHTSGSVWPSDNIHPRPQPGGVQLDRIGSGDPLGLSGGSLPCSAPGHAHAPDAPRELLGVSRERLATASSRAEATEMVVSRQLAATYGVPPSRETVGQVVDLLHSDPSIRGAFDRLFNQIGVRSEA
jgi:hypothetical protein